MFSRMNRRLRIKSREISPSSGSGIQHAKQIKIDGQGSILSVAFLVDEKHIVSAGREGKIRRWRVEDGTEVGMPMDAGSTVRSIAVSRDGKWVISGTQSGLVTVWNAETHEKVSEFAGHGNSVCAVDVSPDGTRIATGSHDFTACVWSLSTGARLLGLLKHSDDVAAVKFSPDGRLVATATWDSDSVRIYDSQDGRLLVDVPIQVSSPFNQSLAWTSDNKQLFVLSCDGNINCLDVFTGTTRSQWPIHSNSGPSCITLASNDTFIAASADSSVSFWDTTTHKQIGPVIMHTAGIQSVAISANYDLAIGGGETITFRSLYDILPSSYSDNIFAQRVRQRVKVEIADLEETMKSLRAQEKDSDSKIVHLEESLQQLRNKFSDSQRATALLKDNLSETIKSLRAQDSNSNREIARLKEIVEQLRNKLADAQHKTDILNETIESLRVQERNSIIKIADLEQQLRTRDASSRGRADSLIQVLRAYEQKHQCEVLYAEGRIIDAALSLLEITNTANKEVRTNRLIMDWLAEFRDRCVLKLEIMGDGALDAGNREEAAGAYSTALLLGPSAGSTSLVKWASTALTRNSVDEALRATAKFNLPSSLIYRAICDVLEVNGRVSEAIECFRKMQSELREDKINHDERVEWEFGFRRRCTERLEKLGDVAMDSQDYNGAAEHFSTILSLNPVDRMDVLTKRSKARALMKSWETALSDADEAIKIDPSCHRGYELRHAALHGAGLHVEAIESFDMMLRKIDESPDVDIRQLRRRYVDARPTVQRIVAQIIRPMPQILIDTTTGRLYDKKQQAEAFKALPIYSELVSAMTIQLDYTRILEAVKGFYRYVMLSHRWEYDEPLLQKVENISIYDLEASPANVKLQEFCSLVRSLGFQWAWSDTCCINKLDHVVLQESLVAMFTWYRGSSLTVVYLRGVSSESQLPGGLRRCIWNTRAWAFQEYLAAETVQFYTEDWKPYLGLTLSNHKESPVVISEMEQVTGVSAQETAVLRPGLERVREKLYLASMRQTTRVEDMAYSLLGIFNVAIPIVYGEGDRAIGRLLEHILAGSGDLTILAWTGDASTYNSCLPVDLAVYNQLVPPHIPRSIKTDEMNNMVTVLRSSLPDLSLAVMLHNHLSELPSPSTYGSRLRLPGIVFRLTELVPASGPDPVTELRVYHSTTSMFGDVEIQTADDLTGMKNLCLVHPWIRPLLEQEFSDSAAVLDRTTQALRFVARLRQPFGAFLLAQVSRVEYRRVATDSLIMVQVREDVPLTELIDNIRTIEVR